ncbi:alpha-galactosidase [Bifidobacterium goeldii]|uniref:Alpha-galactosidase n=1 Tax=Bifidobacterium goeldii TaxID=2306975 RepID=A0A430FL03_9BIFI|nr:glycoside hydrolase family 36 protein [Bifidobacterium goeldii]RSX53526.1 alpha-galactosidase [Bifidobacterium goeldii]
MTELTWGNKAVTLTIAYDEEHPACLAGVRVSGDVAGQAVCAQLPYHIPMVDIMASGRGTGHAICNNRLVQTSIGASLRVRETSQLHDQTGDHLTIISHDVDETLEVKQEFLLPTDCAVVQVTATVTNLSETPLVLESVVPLALSFGVPSADSARALADGGAQPGVHGWSLLQCRNDWLAEGRWTWAAVRDLCPEVGPKLKHRDQQGSYKVIGDSTFSTGASSPIGMLRSEDRGMAWMFQIEHNGAWIWEIGEDLRDGYFALSGPDWRHHGWTKVLDAGEWFTSVPVSVTLSDSFDAAAAAMTHYRRALHDPVSDIARPKLIFNDYMNTLNGDPTEAKLEPLIRGAAQVGAEVFCIDAGWYDDTGDWWPSVGAWEPSATRFPSGLKHTIDIIRENGMIPGLWMEPEVVGVLSPVAHELPDDAFFLHRGARVAEQQRYHLDFRNPLVIEHMNTIVDRLINEYGIGYFKFDYNIMPGPGTDAGSDGPGDGLLEHNRAYLRWIHDLHVRHPELQLESCSSGGMRTDFAQSRRFELLSTSDQEDFRIYPTIASAAPFTMLPEQAGNWAYPEHGMDAERFAFALTNSLLGHFFLSGYVNTFEPWQIDMVARAIATYCDVVRPIQTAAVPFWPTGLPGWRDPVVTLGLHGADADVITLWARGGESQRLELRVPESVQCKAYGDDARSNAQLLFPVFGDGDDTAGAGSGVATDADGAVSAGAVPSDSRIADWHWSWNADSATLTVDTPAGDLSARTFIIR